MTPMGVRNARIQAILEMLWGSPERTAAEVAQALGMGQENARRYLETLVRERRVKTHGKGLKFYSIADEEKVR